MTDYLPTYSEHGRLAYLPTSAPDPLGLRTGIFEPRRCRPHRIRIASLSASTVSREDWQLKREKKEEAKKAKKARKELEQLKRLASRREGPKHFFSSIFSSDPPPSPTQEVVSARSSIRSTSTRRSSQEHRSEPSSPQEEDHNMVGTVMTRPRVASTAAISAPMPHRPSIGSTVSAASSRSNGSSELLSKLASDEKPVAQGNGVSISIALAEPVLFLQGFEPTDTATGNTAMLRGSLHLKVVKAAKIKAVTLKFKGKAMTRWPEGIPPHKTEFEEVDVIMNHTWPFFNAQFPTAEAGTCADYVQLAKTSSNSSSNLSIPTVSRFASPMSSTYASSREHKRLSLQVNQSRSFGKGDSSTNGPSVATKGYRTFEPGEYVYNFELPLDSRLPETIDVELGSVKYELEAVIERAGAFRANLIGGKEVTLIRAPAEGSLEQVEPIAISRNWEDQLHYDIVISGKSFPLGSQVPIAFKLTPLAKVQCHRIKVFVTENIEYFCNNKRVHRMEPNRKVQLFEKRADGMSSSSFPGSSMRILSGGGLNYDQRQAAARGEEVLIEGSTNLLGDLEGNHNVGPTEMEFNVQLPSCANMSTREKSQRLHFDTTYQNIQVHHWIKIVMRLSKPDPNDSSRRRHFEISIDSPFHILSCRATQANTALPAYSSPMDTPPNGTSFPECGCPGAAQRRGSPTFMPVMHAVNGMPLEDSPNSSSEALAHVQSPGLARPQQAHLGGAPAIQRPIHFLRAPSYNPPAFEDDEPPPPLITPPPQYDDIASPTSGLADYFSRLSDAYDEESDSDMTRARSRGRVEVPLTPGSTRVNRSMDEQRTWLPIGHPARG